MAAGVAVAGHCLERFLWAVAAAAAVFGSFWYLKTRDFDYSVCYCG